MFPMPVQEEVFVADKREVEYFGMKNDNYINYNKLQ